MRPMLLSFELFLRWMLYWKTFLYLATNLNRLDNRMLYKECLCGKGSPNNAISTDAYPTYPIFCHFISKARMKRACTEGRCSRVSFRNIYPIRNGVKTITNLYKGSPNNAIFTDADPTYPIFFTLKVSWRNCVSPRSLQSHFFA